MELYEICEIINNREEKEINSGYVVSNSKINFITGDIKEDKVVNAIPEKVDMRIMGDYLQLDAHFKSSLANECRLSWQTLESYSKNLHESAKLGDFKEKVNEWVPSCSFTFVVTKCVEDGYLVLLNPIFWSIQPQAPGSKNNNVLRILFERKNVYFETAEIDVTNILSAAEREVELEEFMHQEQELAHLDTLAEKEAEKRFQEKQYQQKITNRH